MRIIITLICILTALLLLIWIGLKVKPAAFPKYPQAQPKLEYTNLPSGLPQPVENWYRKQYGVQLPLIKTAVVTGRGTMRISGIMFPARFRFIHEAGKNYRHYFELTWFGAPIMKANERYVDGKEVMELPFGVQQDNPKLDQGGALGMWAELLKWAPAAIATDSNVKWEAVDAESAFLVVPFGQGQERFLLRFNPETSELTYMEAMRYKSGEGEKILWINGTWFDEGRPWAVFNAEEVLYNVDVSVSSKGL